MLSKHMSFARFQSPRTLTLTGESAWIFIRPTKQYHTCIFAPIKKLVSFTLGIECGM